MAEAAADGLDGDAGVQEAGGGKVAEVVEADGRIDPGLLPQAPLRTGPVEGSPRRQAVGGGVRRTKPVPAEDGLGDLGPVLELGPPGAEGGDRAGVEAGAPSLVGLGVLLDEGPVGLLVQGPGDDQLAGVEVDVDPPEGRYLAPPAADLGRQAEEGGELEVGEHDGGDHVVGEGGRTSASRTDGRLASLAGLSPRWPQRTAWSRDPVRMLWIWRTVEGARPTSRESVRYRASMSRTPRSRLRPHERSCRRRIVSQPCHGTG